MLAATGTVLASNATTINSAPSISGTPQRYSQRTPGASTKVNTIAITTGASTARASLSAKTAANANKAGIAQVPTETVRTAPASGVWSSEGGRLKMIGSRMTVNRMRRRTTEMSWDG